MFAARPAGGALVTKHSSASRQAIIWLGLIILMLEEVRRLASSPELHSYGPPLANGTPPLVQLILLNAGETQDTRFPCNGLLSFRGVADPLLSARGAAFPRPERSLLLRSLACFKREPHQILIMLVMVNPDIYIRL